ncbi:hypothetical protein C9446_11220 [Providencia heimbachae]|uniref:hypothetical protein n=1 Tax=Providencia heimbachae TaxID=333962 RepID=UPI0010BEE12F|nr:hypothetical protein [Providencia heimbachae]QCJ70374.1 hypothetical protein C9446_11220 [Providencia heimbachae]
MIIQSHLLRAALVCVAKNDPRYYLQGVHINSKYIEATNGHVALRMEHGIKTRRDTILEFRGAIPAKAVTTEICFTKEPYAVHRDASNNRIGFAVLLSYDNARFPDLDRIIPSNFESCLPHFQAAYLAYPEKMFGISRGVNPISFHPSGMTTGCLFKFSNVINQKYGNPQFIVMPCRA